MGGVQHTPVHIYKDVTEMNEEFEQFDGREKSVFAEMIKSGVRDLIDDLVKTETEFFSKDNTQEDIENYTALRNSFRKCHLLVSEKIQNDELKKRINNWIWEDKSAGAKKTRKDSIKEAGELVEEFLAELSIIGLIDLKGGSYAGAYPFTDMLIGKITPPDGQGLDMDNFSVFDKALLKTIIRYKERMSEASKGEQQKGEQ